MSETLNKWWAQIQSVFSYEIKLGDSVLTLNGILEMLVIMVLVLVVERYLRRLLRRKIPAQPISNPTCNTPSAALWVIASSPWVSASRSA